MIISIFTYPCHGILKLKILMLNPLQNMHQRKHKEIRTSDTDNKKNRD